MKFYGSLNNRLMENTLQVLPEVGMGATVTLYSDRHAYTIKELSKETVKVTLNTDKGLVTRTYPKYVIASRCKAIIINDESIYGNPEYKYEDTDKLRKFIFHKPSGLYREETKNLNGLDENGHLNYEGTGRTKKDNLPLILGVREEYYDPHF